MPITDGAKIIKGHPGGPDGKWDAVQAIQHEPFVYIQYNGSHFAGQEEDDVEKLLQMLAEYRLGDCWPDTYSLNPCSGIRNPEWNYLHADDVPKYIDGPRMYAADGVYRFSGNFENYSHAFGIDTNHQPTIDALIAAIDANRTQERK